VSYLHHRGWENVINGMFHAYARAYWGVQMCDGGGNLEVSVSKIKKRREGAVLILFQADFIHVIFPSYLGSL